jgi:cell division protein FtsN
MKAQRGGFVLGLIIGVLVGIVLALLVALYVTKVPVPFVNKVPQRTAEQDAAEAERNKNWDPNSGLATKPGARPASAPGPVSVTPPAPVVTATPAPVPAPAPAAPPARDPAAILSDRATAALPPPTSAGTASDPFVYFVQAGAYARPEDAEQQRARLGLLGFEARLTEREQSGRTVWRVRIGPFDKREAAEGAKDKLAAGGVEAALVRVQK